MRQDHHATPEEAGKIFTQGAPWLAVYSYIVPPDVPDVFHTRGRRTPGRWRWEKI